MDRDNRIGGVVLAAKHLLGFGGIELRFERVQRRLEVGGDVLAAGGPFEENADIVNALVETVAQLEILREPALPLQGLLRFRLVVPEIRRGDLCFELR